MTQTDSANNADTIVLGAGMVGVSVAVHLAMRGQSVVLVDRRAPGEEASFGNGGLIQREGLFPHGFPQGLGALLRYGRNRSNDMHYHPSAMLRLAPFLFKYWTNSRNTAYARIVKRYAKLIEQCTTEHQALADAAGASDRLKSGGWIRTFRTEQGRDGKLAQLQALQREFGLACDVLDPAALQALEPHLAPVMVGGIHYRDPLRVEDPHGLTMAYVDLFKRLGGRFIEGDARTLTQSGTQWSVDGPGGTVRAGHAVIALGAWSDTITRTLGYRLPLAAKRGYHMHYRPVGNAVLNHPVLDTEGGYLMAPMKNGIRITTGVEFARPDASKTPVQLGRVEPVAKALFPLGDRVDDHVWMGLRPCTPDMMPVIGPAPRHKNLWFSFGHAHHGFTLGPVTGRLIAEMISGDTPFVDPAPFSATRF